MCGQVISALPTGPFSRGLLIFNLGALFNLVTDIAAFCETATFYWFVAETETFRVFACIAYLPSVLQGFWTMIGAFPVLDLLWIQARMSCQLAAAFLQVAECIAGLAYQDCFFSDRKFLVTVKAWYFDVQLTLVGLSICFRDFILDVVWCGVVWAEPHCLVLSFLPELAALSPTVDYFVAEETLQFGFCLPA